MVSLVCTRLCIMAEFFFLRVRGCFSQYQSLHCPLTFCHLCVTYTFHLKTDKVSAEAINCLHIHKESSILANVIHSLAATVHACRIFLCLLNQIRVKMHGKQLCWQNNNYTTQAYEGFFLLWLKIKITYDRFKRWRFFANSFYIYFSSHPCIF